MNLPPLGMQLISFGRSALEKYKNPDAVLDAVRAAGFLAIEGSTPADPVARKQKLADRGMRFAGDHVNCAGLADEKLDALVRNVLVGGAQDVCVSGLLGWTPWTLDNYLRSIEQINRAGKRLRREGIYLHYHNHDFEFKATAGTEEHPKLGMEILSENLDWNVCDLCVDVAWVLRGNLDPARYLRAVAGRVGYLHLKDTTDTEWIELGRGKVNFDSVIAVLPELPNLRWVMYEQDSTKLDPAESAAISRAFLKEKFGW